LLSENSRLKEAAEEGERRWRAECDRLAAENDLLRGKAGEAVLAAQWRGRFEACSREKEELREKLALYTKLSNDFNSAGISMDQALIDMQRDFKVFFIIIINIHSFNNRCCCSLMVSPRTCLYHLLLDLRGDRTTVRSPWEKEAAWWTQKSST
jgi:hypothetical protein